MLDGNSWMVAMWSGEHPLELLTAYGNEGVIHWSRHGRSLEFWHAILKYLMLNVLVLWCSCVVDFDGWKYRKRIRLRQTIKMSFFDCMKAICNWVVHKIGHPQSKFDTKNSFLAWMHTIWTLGLNWGKCYMWELFHCRNIRLIWWTHSTAFMVMDELDTLEFTCMKHETCPSTRRVWLVRCMGNWMVCKRAMFVCFATFDFE